MLRQAVCKRAAASATSDNDRVVVQVEIIYLQVRTDGNPIIFSHIVALQTQFALICYDFELRFIPPAGAVLQAHRRNKFEEDLFQRLRKRRRDAP